MCIYGHHPAETPLVIKQRFYENKTKTFLCSKNLLKRLPEFKVQTLFRYCFCDVPQQYICNSTNAIKIAHHNLWTNFQQNCFCSLVKNCSFIPIKIFTIKISVKVHITSGFYTSKVFFCTWKNFLSNTALYITSDFPFIFIPEREPTSNNGYYKFDFPLYAIWNLVV